MKKHSMLHVNFSNFVIGFFSGGGSKQKMRQQMWLMMLNAHSAE